MRIGTKNFLSLPMRAAVLLPFAVGVANAAREQQLASGGVCHADGKQQQHGRALG